MTDHSFLHSAGAFAAQQERTRTLRGRTAPTTGPTTGGRRTARTALAHRLHRLADALEG